MRLAPRSKWEVTYSVHQPYAKNSTAYAPRLSSRPIPAIERAASTVPRLYQNQNVYMVSCPNEFRYHSEDHEHRSRACLDVAGSEPCKFTLENLRTSSQHSHLHRTFGILKHSKYRVFNKGSSSVSICRGSERSL